MSTAPRGGPGNVFDGKMLTVRTGRFDQLTDSPLASKRSLNP